MHIILSYLYTLVDMIFDSNVLNIVCKFISDPKSFMNFALANSKTRYIANLRRDDKMDEFSKRTVNDWQDDGYNYYTVIEYRLPNGKLHGVQHYSCLYPIIGDKYMLYYNGILLAKWNFQSRDTGMRCHITYHKCRCIGEFPRSYIIDRIGLAEFKLESMTTRCGVFDCKTCGAFYEVELWIQIV